MNGQSAARHTAAQTLATLQQSSVLAAKDRELATVAALAAMGRKVAPQLPAHIHAALDAGATQQQIIEGLATISQASGTPTAVNSIAIADRVFAERIDAGTASADEGVWDDGDAPGGTVEERAQRAQGTIEKVYPAGPTDDTYTSVAARAPHFWRDAATVFYNDLFLHPGSDIKYRELFIMSTYIALNSTPLQMKWHTNGALNNGWSRQEVMEVITQLTPYVGVPNALSAARLTREVFVERDTREVTKPHEADTRGEVNGPFAAIIERGRWAIKDRTGHDDLPGQSWGNAATVAPRLYGLAASTLLGDALDEGTGLDQRTRHIAVVAALAAHGAEADQLAVQIHAARRAGITDTELAAAVRLSAAIAGNGVAENAESLLG